MTPEEVEQLRRFEGRRVTITCSDGEVLQGKILHVDDEHRDAIFDLVSTTTPEKYKQGANAAYVIRWADVVDFRECQ
jgi:small nuclear ribonucleoprotein (snRNP)-like protein